MEPIKNILNTHSLASAQPAPTPDPLSPADDEFPDPFATKEPEQPTEPTEQSTELPDVTINNEPEEASEVVLADSQEQADSTNLEPEVDLDEEETPSTGEPSIHQLQSLKRAIHTMQDQLASMLRMIQMMQGASVAVNQPRFEATKINSPTFSPSVLPSEETGTEQIIEGVFDGMQMVGPDGKTYSVPPNYASKSKIVEGDFMKLTITPSGKFLYKQIGPIERKRLVGELVQGADEEHWSVLAEGRAYHILKASVTFYNARPGDEVVILVPSDGESSWGAVENVMHK